MKTYHFNAAERDLSDFMYAYSPVPKEHKPFVLWDDCLANYPVGAPEAPENSAYVSIISKEAYASGTKFSTTCSFGEFGAPLIVFTDDLGENTDGTGLYGLHFEVVAYEGGCNFWHIEPWPERVERPIKTQKIAFEQFEIKPDERITITVEVKGKTITAWVNGHEISCENADVPEKFHVGITACEGPNNFYDFTIED